MKRIGLFSYLLTTSLLSAVLATAPLTVFAQTNGERIIEFNATLEIEEDNTVLVEESILYDFGNAQRHGIFRYVPSTIDINDTIVTVPLEFLSVENENGVDYEWTDESTDYTGGIRIGDPNRTITGQHWYVIRYRVNGVVVSYEEADELFWNVTGNGWDVPIERATATIVLPSESDSQAQRARCFTGIFGATIPLEN